MSTLPELQAEFTRALLDPERTAPAALLSDGAGRVPGLDVYRNNRLTSLCDALAATYPAILRLVGEAFFRAVAQVFVQEQPPRSPVLHEYGAGFGEFLEAFPPAAGVPYLGDVARLEWSCLCAYHAADVDPIPLSRLATVPAVRTPALVPRLHPSLALHRSRWPIGALWSAMVNADDEVKVDLGQGQDVLVVRPALAVEVRVLPPGAYSFVRALADGASLERAAGLAAAEDDRFDLVTQLSGLFSLGAVVAVPGLDDEV
ncbi:MAG: putative DNA-binding domain-containing protein [Gammaproteobacteria bacterium]|nr:putative DNA-binding domain-containing protein [Gammaproteobacteria bacterium]